MLVDHMLEALRAHGRGSLADGEIQITYADLDSLSADYAAAIARDLPTDRRARVGIKAVNSVSYIEMYLAVLRAGAVPFLIDQALGTREIAVIAEDCGLDALIHDPQEHLPPGATRVRATAALVLSRLAPPEDPPDLHETTEVCRFTSGSTGRPTCIEFSGRAVGAAAETWTEGTGLTGEDRILCLASLSNGLAFNTSLLSAFLVGAHLHLGHGLPTAGRVSRLLTASGATRLIGFPAVYESMVRHYAAPVAFDGLRLAVSSAAPLSPETMRRFIELTGVPVQNYFGAAEAGPLTFAADPVNDPGLGQPLPGVRLRAGTPGDPQPIEVASGSMGTRYLNLPGGLEAKLTPDGFYRTGDVGYLDGGSLVLTGRVAGVVNVGGRKIDAVEVATVLRTAAGVADAVVFETPDRHGSPALAAVIAGSPLPDPVAVRRHAATLLAPHKVPTLVRSVPDIPRGSAGKPAMAALIRLFEQPSPDGGQTRPEGA